MQKDPSGNPAPAGGFQNLGWYSGYQYYNGTFAPQRGVIHPNSPQQGAGQAVSSEVNKQSAQAQGVNYDNFVKYLSNGSQNTNSLPGESGSFSNSSNPSGLGNGSNLGISTPEVLNLPNLYKNLYDQSGISDLEKQVTDKTNKYNEVKAGINDNPYLAEATRTGRIAKLDEKFMADIQTVKNDIATKKADIEMKLNLETKQFDIESQVAQQALDRFNTLLSMGALDNASGEDIANITRSTGLSSSAIYSAIKANQAKNIDTQVIQYDDGTNQGFAVINSKTGEVISTQTVAQSKSKGGSGNGDLKQSDYVSLLKDDAKKGATLSQIFAIYGGFLDADLIYQLYNANSKYGPDKGNISNLAKYGVTQPKSGNRAP